MAKKKRSGGRPSSTPADARRVGSRAMLPHHLPYVDHVAAMDGDREGAELMAEQAAWAMGILAQAGRRVPATELLPDDVDVVARKLAADGVEPVLARAVFAALAYWVDYLQAVGQWSGNALTAEVVLTRLDEELGEPKASDLATQADESADVTTTILRYLASEVSEQEREDWADTSFVVRLADVVLERVVAGVAVDPDGFPTQDALDEIGQALGRPADPITVRGVWFAFVEEGVIERAADGGVLAGSHATCWRSPGPERTDLAEAVARQVIAAFQTHLDAAFLPFSAAAELLTSYLPQIATGTQILTADDLRSEIADELSGPQTEDPGRELLQLERLRDVIGGLQEIGLLGQNGFMLAVPPGWLRPLLRFVEENSGDLLFEDDESLMAEFAQWVITQSLATGVSLDRDEMALVLDVLDSVLEAVQQRDPLAEPTGFGPRAFQGAYVDLLRGLGDDEDQQAFSETVAQVVWQYLTFLGPERWTGTPGEWDDVHQILELNVPAEHQHLIRATRVAGSVPVEERLTYLGGTRPIRIARAVRTLAGTEVLRGGHLKMADVRRVADEVGLTVGPARRAAQVEWFAPVWDVLLGREDIGFSQGRLVAKPWSAGADAVDDLEPLLEDCLSTYLSSVDPDVEPEVTELLVAGLGEPVLPASAGSAVARVLDELGAQGILVPGETPGTWAAPRALAAAILI